MGDEGLFKAYDQGQGALFPAHLAEGLDPSDPAFFIDEVVAALANRPSDLHVVVTGRNAKPELIEAADLVTEMTLVKHPFREQGVKAQKGIEF